MYGAKAYTVTSSTSPLVPTAFGRRDDMAIKGRKG
jgi:hypothetical protein